MVGARCERVPGVKPPPRPGCRRHAETERGEGLLGASSEGFQARQQAERTADNFGGPVSTRAISLSNWGSTGFHLAVKLYFSVISLLVPSMKSLFHWTFVYRLLPLP